MAAESNFKKITTACIVLTLCLCPLESFAQTITGTITTIHSKRILVATITIRDSLRPENIQEYSIARNGLYTIHLKNRYGTIIVGASAGNYHSESFRIENPDPSQKYVHDFVLQKEEINPIEEVRVAAKTKFTVTEDTLKYTVSAYRDGSERKIQDLIKKLPGIEVNEKSGEIRYKGRSIETVTLEGDNLFGSNYTLGTKNINIDLVEQVQAITNYAENPLLKDIENDEKVALNLKLKKGILDYTGDASLGIGLTTEEKATHNSGVTVLGISKKYKSFGNLSFNNVAVNNSPFDYFTLNPSTDEIREEEFHAKKMILESYYSNPLNSDRINANNLWFGNYNLVFKVSDRLSVKTNLYDLHDNIFMGQRIENNYLANGQNIHTSDYSQARKKPIQQRADLELKYLIAKKALLEYKFSLSNEKITTNSENLQNAVTNYRSELNTENFYLKQSLLVTKKIAPQMALQTTFMHARNDIPQLLNLKPPPLNAALYTMESQYSHFKKETLQFQSELLGSKSKNRYALAIGAAIEKNSFDSRHVTHSLDGNPNSDFINTFTFAKKKIFHSAAYHLYLGKLKISPTYTTSYLKQEITSYTSTNRTKSTVVFEPEISINYKLNETSFLSATGNLKQQPFSEEYQTERPILINGRTSIANTADLQLQKIWAYRFFYLINNLYKQFQLRLDADYLKTAGNYYSDITIQENTTQIQNFYSPRSNERISTSFLIEKYIPGFKSTIRWQSHYALFTYKNMVNDSNLRNNKGTAFLSELFVKTAFRSILNFENIFNYTQNSSQDESSKYKVSSVNNKSKIIFRFDEKWFAIVSTEYSIPNVKKTHENYLFLDAIVRFTPKHKKFELNFVAKNIFNKVLFTQTDIADYYTTTTQSNLIPGYYMGSFAYNF